MMHSNSSVVRGLTCRITGYRPTYIPSRNNSVWLPFLPGHYRLLQIAEICCKVLDVSRGQRLGHGTHKWIGACAALEIL